MNKWSDLEAMVERGRAIVAAGEGLVDKPWGRDGDPQSAAFRFIESNGADALVTGVDRMGADSAAAMVRADLHWLGAIRNPEEAYLSAAAIGERANRQAAYATELQRSAPELARLFERAAASAERHPTSDEQHHAAVETLKDAMRKRGDSERAVAMAETLAAERFRPGHSGRVGEQAAPRAKRTGGSMERE